MKEFRKLIQQQFNKMCKTGKLFRSSITGAQLWEIYLKNTEKSVFRDPNSTSFNCNNCNNFIRRYGNVVSIDENYNIISMFDIDIDGEYSIAAKELSKALKSSTISEVFFETFEELNKLPYESCKKTNNTFKLGIFENYKQYTKDEVQKYGNVEEGKVYTFNHFGLDLPKEFVDQSGKSVESIMGEFRDAKNVFQRAMEEISLDTLILVKDLINQGSLLDGTTHLYKIEQIIPLKKEFDKIRGYSKTELSYNWCWVNSYKLPFAKFRNELIGVLCSELSEGMELNTACQNWNKRVDPANYMKATAPITKKQIEEAKKFVQENGYEESFDRRFATIDDIKASEILHLNSGDSKIKSVSIFDNVKSTSTRHKRAEFDKVETVSIDKFMRDILPGCTSIEAFLENRMEGNMVSLTTANNPDSKPIFKWSNNYSWTFNGNLAGKSQIKENVKAAGGKITGILRSSLQWNDEDTKGIVDFDLHCKTPFSEIYYSSKIDRTSKGWLDVDMINPTKTGIENITWQEILKDGVYKFFVRNFSGHKNHNGFKFEIEFGGNIFNYQYNERFTSDINVATITVKNGEISIIHHLPESSSSKEIYGLETNNFHKINLVCLSPNHWDENNVGNKHYMFMLDKAKSPISIRSFHNENLIPELASHRKVLEVLANQCMIESTDRQLSGLGFNNTVKDELVVRLQGSHKRIVKIQF
jgi:hypothetical protein